MVEGMPLAAADELALTVIHHAVGVGEREGGSQLCVLTPATGGTVDGVVGVPVVDILAPFAGEDALVNVVVLAVGDVVSPVVEHVVVVLHALGVKVGSSHGTSRPGEFLAGDLQGLQGEVNGVAGLVENRFPHQHAGVVAVATDDIAGVLVYHLAPFGVFVPVLPARCGHDDKKAQFVAGIHERRVLRVMSGADDVHAGLLQTQGVAPLLRVGQGVAHVGKILMTVAAHQLVIGFAVEPEAVLAAEFSLADAHADDAAVSPSSGRPSPDPSLFRAGCCES